MRPLVIGVLSLALAVAAGASTPWSRAGELPHFQALELGPGKAARDAFGSDVTHAEYRAVREAIARYRERHGMLPAPATAGSAASELPERYAFLPFSGVYGEEIWAHNFVDLDANVGIEDWDCSDYTYDGHKGHDYTIRTFAEQELGVPFYSALPGRVIQVIDDLPDQETSCSGERGNHLVVDHGGGQVSLYWHLKTGSARVAEGELVEAGQELALIASSGCSTWPHLHFETWVDNLVVEPSTGRCNPGASGWTKQRRVLRTTRLYDFGFTHRGPRSLGPENLPPYPFPRSGQIGRRDDFLYFWFYVLNLPAGSAYRVAARSPDGVLRYDSGELSLGNPEFTRFTLGYDAIDMTHLAGRLGTWTVDVAINGKTLVSAPVEVRKRRTRRFNRAPARARRVRLTPGRPRADAPVVCTAKVRHLLEDPDYDVVSYLFEWTVGDRVLRRATSAARTDVLAANRAARGERLTCTVTPSDGRLEAEPRSRTARVR